MHRTQILLDDWQYEVLKSRAERERRSLSSLVREILGEQLAKKGARSTDPLEKFEGVADCTAAYGRGHDDVLYGKRR